MHGLGFLNWQLTGCNYIRSNGRDLWLCRRSPSFISQLTFLLHKPPESQVVDGQPKLQARVNECRHEKRTDLAVSPFDTSLEYARVSFFILRIFHALRISALRNPCQDFSENPRTSYSQRDIRHSGLDWTGTIKTSDRILPFPIVTRPLRKPNC